MKTGLVLEGGAMRGMYTAGVLDVLHREGVHFDGIMGVSAGALFGPNFLSGQEGRVIRYNKRFIRDRRYQGLGCLLRTGDLFSRDFAYGTVPRELDEAATIDGSGEYSTLLRIVVPIAKPGIATIALLNALAYWNDWFNSLLYIRQHKILQPLQALLMELQNNVDYLNRMAGQLGAAAINEAAKLPTQSLRMVLVVLIVVPIACAYPFFQRYIVSGLAIGSVKG